MHRSRAATTQEPIRDKRHNSCDDRDLDVAEVVVERLVAAAKGPADPGENHTPERVAEQGEDVVPPERHLEDPGRDRDERARDRGDAAEEDGPVVPPVEPPVRPVDLLSGQVQPAAVALEEGAAAALPDPPADVRADLVPDDAGCDDEEVSREPRRVP